jgi:hypothetical protein
VTVFGLDAGSRSLREADHLIHDLVARLPGPVVAGTHLIRGDRPHIAVSLESDVDSLPIGPELSVASAGSQSGPDGLAAAQALARHGVSGRAVVFPGSELTGAVRVGDLLAGSSIDRLHVVGGSDQPGADDFLDTRDHLRPEWQNGELVLAVTPAGPGRFAPFEVPNPTPCCADH